MFKLPALDTSRDALLFYFSSAAAVLIAIAHFEYSNAEGTVLFFVLILVMIASRRAMQRNKLKKQ